MKAINPKCEFPSDVYEEVRKERRTLQYVAEILENSKTNIEADSCEERMKRYDGANRHTSGQDLLITGKQCEVLKYNLP